MKVGIIGAGTMGSGIAQAFAQTEGYEVYLCDINDEFAANGKKKIAKGFEKRIAKGKMDLAFRVSFRVNFLIFIGQCDQFQSDVNAN